MKGASTAPFIYTILFFSALAGLGCEMVWTRMFAVGLGHEIVAVLAVIAAFFTGMALGALSLDGVVSRSRRPGRWYSILELLIGLWSLVLIFLIPHANRFAAAIFLFPTIFMGAAFSHLAQAARGRKNGLGRALCTNTLGASLAPIVFGVLLVPAIGSKLSLLAVTAGYLLLIPPGPWVRWVPAAVPLGLAIAFWLQSGSFNLVSLTPNARIAVHIEGVMTAVTVIEGKRGDYSLKVNNKFTMGGRLPGFRTGGRGTFLCCCTRTPKVRSSLAWGPGPPLQPLPIIPALRPTVWN